MTTNSTMIAKLAAAIGVTAILTLGSVTPSLAANSNDGGPFVYQSSTNGSTWSTYDGYTASANARVVVKNSAARGAHAEVRGATRGSAVRADDPPGSAYQSWGNTDSQGGR